MDDAFILLMYFIGFITATCVAGFLILVGRLAYCVFILLWLCIQDMFKDIKRSIQS